MAQLEHLLYYGADINSQNMNGNTPLHICAVNNQVLFLYDLVVFEIFSKLDSLQEACARVLLFRSADAQIVNNQGQTAYHVAVITGHVEIAELFKNHDPQKAGIQNSSVQFIDSFKICRWLDFRGESVCSLTFIINQSIFRPICLMCIQ